MKRIASVLLIVLGSTTGVCAGDWPQFRHDAGRSASSPDELAQQLHVQWVREFSVPRPAFPSELRLRYDASYEPVVMDKTMFVPSMVNDTVTALDTETGIIRWTFFADGPVRFAPVAWQDRVFFVSDDGYLYCLGAIDGKLHWKFRGAPSDRKEQHLLGNQRLISLWPARGGPVLVEGIIYFAAGIWPSRGIFIHALDASTGDVVWSNTDSHYLAEANLDHGVKSHAGLTPQGYLAVAGDKLVVPCGAQLPAFLDRKTGTLEKYTLGWGGRIGLPKGSWFVASNGKYLVQSGDLYDLTRTNDERFRDSRGMPDFKSLLYSGGYTRLMIDRTNQKGLGQFRQPVLTADAIYYTSHDSGIVGFDIAKATLNERKKATEPDIRKQDEYPDRLKASFNQLWRLPSKSTVHIKVHQRLYAGGDGYVEAIDIPQASGEPKVAWRAKIEGTPNRMLAADEKLFVVTREGRIYAFGARPPQTVVRHVPSKTLLASNADQWTNTAAKALREAKVQDGYALVLGLQSGRLVEELLRQSDCYVIALDRDAERVAAMRERFLTAGLYGTRVAVHLGEPLQYPLPPLLANLVISEDLGRVTPDLDENFARRLRHVLRPYGGTACLTLPDADRDKFASDFKSSNLDGAVVESRGNLVLFTRPGPLPGAANWSHQAANAANTDGSQDQFLRAPLALLWFDGSLRWHRKPGSAEVRVAGGRVFVLAGNLWAGDAYTGRHLWKVALPAGVSPRRGSGFVALDDAVYLAGGRTCHVLDAATGQPRKTIMVPTQLGDGTSSWNNLRISGDRLVANVGKQLVCIDLLSGDLHWKFELQQPHVSLAVGGGKVFCSELPQARRGRPAGGKPRTTALNLTTGKLLWEKSLASRLRYSEPHDLLVTTSEIFRGSDGSLVRAGGTRGAVAGDRLVGGEERNMLVTHDLVTGKQTFDQMQWVTRGCTPLRAGPNIATTRFRANAAYIDLVTRKITPLYNVRSGCNNNLVPANGVLNIPNLSGGCTCNYTPTSLAYVPTFLIEGK